MYTTVIVLVMFAALLGPPALVALSWLVQGVLQWRAQRQLLQGAIAQATRTAHGLLWMEGIKVRIFHLMSYPTFDRHRIERRLYHLGVTGTVIRVAGILQGAGELDEAEQLLDGALDHTREIGAESTRGQALILCERAACRIYRGAVAEARPLLERAVAIERELARQRPQDADAEISAARLAQAIAWGADPDSAHVGNALVKLGAVYQTIGDYPAAVRAYEEARKEFGERWAKPREEIGELLNNVGNLFLETGDLDQAEPVLRHAVEYQRRAHGDQHPAYATALLNLAVSHQRSGEYPEAIERMRESIRIRTEVLGASHPESVFAVSHLAHALCEAGDDEAAKPFADQAVAGRLAFGEGHPLHLHALATRARLDVAAGRPADALARLREVTTVERRAIGRTFAVTSDGQRLGYLEKVRQHLFTVLSLVRTHLPEDPAAVAEAFDLVLSRKGLAAEAAAARRDAVLGGRYPHLEGKLRTLSMLHQQIAARVLAGPGSEGGKAHRRVLEEWQERQAALEVELAGAIPEVSLEQRLLAADRHIVAARLPVRSALIEFVRFDLFDYLAVPARAEQIWQPARYLAFVLRPEAPEKVLMVDLGEAEEIEYLVGELRTELLGGPGSGVRGMALFDDEIPEETGPTSPGCELRKCVVGPIQGALEGVEHLIVAPDGELAVVPFEVLPSAEGRPLVESYRFSYLGVGRDALRFGEMGRPPGKPLVIAGPDFDLGCRTDLQSVRAKEDGLQIRPTAEDGLQIRPTVEDELQIRPIEKARTAVSRDLDRSTFRFPPLPGALEEGRVVATLLGVEPAIGPAAVEAELMEASGPRVLHLATHGFFLPDRPAAPGQRFRGALESALLRSGLALAGANTWLVGGTPPPRAGDGLLTAEEVTGLDLLGTELVVLSACETGLGDVSAGEGVFGLRRSFQLAGAAAVVMSLWKVPDEPTRELMEVFYRRLLAGESRAEALRRAQLQTRSRYPDPRDWGAFILQGEPGALRKEG
jgi:tetratricopeptide (TPR) repeat protein